MDTLDNELEQAEVEADLQLHNYNQEHGEAGQPSMIRSTTTRSISTPASQWQSIKSKKEERDLERQQTTPRPLSRIETQRLQYTQTVGGTIASRTRTSREPWPAFGGGKPYPPPLPAREEYVVEFDGHADPLHPQNWSLRRKYYVQEPHQ
jgi:DHA1 family multidrug resistance protein-like MFS transporter